MPKEEKEKKEVEPEVLVVEKLLEQPIRSFVGEDGKEYTTLTRDEAISEILLTVRALKKLL